MSDARPEFRDLTCPACSAGLIARYVMPLGAAPRTVIVPQHIIRSDTGPSPRTTRVTIEQTCPGGGHTVNVF